MTRRREHAPAIIGLAVAAAMMAPPTVAVAATDGFDRQTVDRYLREEAKPPSPWSGLGEAQRQRMTRLSAAAETFRRLAVTDLGALRQTLSPAGDAQLLARFRGTDTPEAHLWQYFLEGSIVYFGHALADTARVGFYNPQLDGWLLADWRDVGLGSKDEHLDLVRLTALTGDTMRNTRQFTHPDAYWVGLTRTQSVTEALLTNQRVAVGMFQLRYPMLSTSDAEDRAISDKTAAEDALVIENRISRMAHALAALDDEPRYGKAVADLQSALASGDAGSLAGLFAADPGPVQRIAGLSRPIREMMHPTAVIGRPQGNAVILGVAYSGRFVLVATYDNAPAPKLASLVFIDLAAAEATR